MKLGIIGEGAIGRYVRDKAIERGHSIGAILVRAERLSDARDDSLLRVASVIDLPDELDHVVDCAGHSALRAYGPDILARGFDMTTVSIGALADPELFDLLNQAAERGGAKLRLASGSVGALDCLRAARVGTVDKVTYTGRKSPASWKGSPAEQRLPLDELTGPAVHFEGSARTAAIEYPKNANVAAAVALAGLGLDDTKVKLVADPDVSENIHQIEASGEFGRINVEIRGNPLPDNPRSSALAAMSAIARLEQETSGIVF